MLGIYIINSMEPMGRVPFTGDILKTPWELGVLGPDRLKKPSGLRL